MPTLPVIDHTYRMTLNWGVVNGITPRNVFHLLAPSDPDPQDLGDALAAGFADITSFAWLFHCCIVAQVCETVDILPLDGVTATQVYDLPVPLTGGTANGDVIPQGAGLISFRSAQRGPRGRGRLYAGPIAESRQDDGVLDSTSRTSMIAAWAELQDSLQGGTPACSITVASYAHADQHPMIGITVDNIIATQRRRLDQLR